MDIINFITTISLFQNLEEKNYQDLSGIVHTRKYKKGEIIFSEYDDADGFYVAITGRVKIYKSSPEGKEQILHIFGPGDPFGEIAVFTGKNFPASAQTLENSETLFFPKNAFIGLIKKDPALSLNMLSVLSMRLKRFSSLIEDLSLKEVPGRLAAYLLYLSDRNDSCDELILDISKSQLASILGTIPETLSRILAKMTRENLIESDGKRKFLIKDRDSLIELAEGEIKLT
jgi:CRP/FNR family transcriptional regulator